MKLTYLLGLAAFCGAGSHGAWAQATFNILGGQSTRPAAMSADGAWITGYNFNGAFRWSAGTGFEPFSAGSNGIPDVGVNGLVSITLKNLNNDEEAGQWLPSGSMLLGGLGGQSGSSISSCYGASDNGGVVVGLGWINAGQAHAFKWTQAGGMVDLLSTFPTRSSRANGVSGNGSMVVGWDEDITGPRLAAIWPNGTPGPVLLAPGIPGEAWDANTSGTVVVGVNNRNLFRWTQAGGLVDLGKLPNSDPNFDDAVGLSVSADGNTIVGFNGNSFFGTPFRAFIWRPGAGMVEMQQLLVALGAPQAANFNLSQSSEVSADGKTICGIAGSAPFGPFDGWLATLPDAATIYCRSQVNSQNCLPAIGFTGNPSASSGAGFNVTAANLIPGVNGILFYSTTGADNAPFLGGTLCAQAPLQRLPVQNSGGAANCSGAFSTDFNAWVPVSGDTALIGGATVWAQYWSRDAASASTTNLTNAIRFTLWP